MREPDSGLCIFVGLFVPPVWEAFHVGHRPETARGQRTPKDSAVRLSALLGHLPAQGTAVGARERASGIQTVPLRSLRLDVLLWRLVPGA